MNMKKLLATILLSVFCLTLTSYAADYLDVWLSWNYNTSTTNLVSNFVVYYARDGGTNFQAAVTVPATNNVAKVRIQITPGVTKSLTFKVTAKNAAGESGFSNTDTIPKTAPVNIPSNLTIFQATIVTNL
jgi:hypothetical protein